MNAKRFNERGFTLAETLIAVAIAVILMGLGFIAIQSHMKNLKQFELDRTAREMFVAAQNHLTMAETQESILSLDYCGTPCPANGDEYFFIVPGDDPDASNSALSRMLPRFSIDVRDRGSYVIRYSPKKPARVLEVFYVDSEQANNGHKFNSASIDVLFSDYSGANKSADRLDYNGAIIGWYAGDDLTFDSFEYGKVPELTVENSDKLIVSIDDESNTILNEIRQLHDSHGNSANAKLRLYITGKTSGHTLPVKLNGSPELAITYDNIYNNRFKNIVLDDVTEIGKHFSELFGPDNGSLTSSEYLYPGEDVTVYFEIYSNDIIMKIIQSPKESVNSLFASIYTSNSGSNRELIGRISSIRHLENLNPLISGYEINTRATADSTAMSFEQTKNLNWSKFAKEINRTYPSSVSIAYLDDTTTGNGLFAPINPTYADNGSAIYLTEYNGKGLSISDIKIDKDSNCGLFGELNNNNGSGNNTEIKNLELINFSVNTRTGDAGALVGTASNVSISNVIVHDGVGVSAPGKVAAADGNAGGLVGSLNNGSVELSAAAVYVESTNGAAGGLLGEATGNTTIKHSFAGAHTHNGTFVTGDPSNPTTDFNVSAGETGTTSVAGGLIGEASGTEQIIIEHCYATTSVKASKAVGGLIGKMDGKSVKDCYATGLVKGDASGGTNVGALVGMLTVSDAVSGNYFLESANSGIPAFGSGSGNATAIDENLNTYEDFCVRTDEAVPYDSTLPDNYTYKAISSLDNSVSGDYFVKRHFGDWTTSEILVHNTPSNTTIEP